MAENKQYSEYKVIHVVEGGCGTLLLGSSGVPVKKMETELNKLASSGWEVVFQKSIVQVMYLMAGLQIVMMRMIIAIPITMIVGVFVMERL